MARFTNSEKRKMRKSKKQNRSQLAATAGRDTIDIE